MATTRSLSDLAQLIHSRTTSIETGLKAANLPQPSFNATAPPALPLSRELEEVRDELVEALEELRALVLGPVGHLFTTMLPMPGLTATLHGIYRFRIAQNLALDETVSHSVLAARCGLPEPDLRRYLRMATSLRLFEEPEKGQVSHSAASAFLASMPAANDMLGTLIEEQVPAGLALADTLQRFPGSEEPSEAAAVLGQNGGLPTVTKGKVDKKQDFYASMSDDPERVRRAASAMSIAAKIPSHSVQHFVEGCGWAESCPRKVVDIGGSEGKLCKALLEKYNAIEEAMSLDRPEVVADVDVPKELEGRLAFGGYDFFEEQKVKGADVYLFRNIFHNWPDKYAVQILRNQIPALKRGARIFVNEACLPEPDATKLVTNRIAWASDLIMKMVFNAMDRSKEDWYALFAKTDERFKVVSITTPPGSGMSIIEVVWQG
ncbi:hypothetical protein JX266_010345 [Neoarthrinium moseri]|nr:hypothetical protein JX266_010345 [Neoarthrinium moseri]